MTENSAEPSTPVKDVVIVPFRETLEFREGQAIEWLFSSEAAVLKVSEARYLIRHRFGVDVDESLRRKFGKAEEPSS